MDDQNLIALYFARDEKASAETYRRFGGYCFKIAQNILGNREDAEECVNDVLIRLWNRIPPTKPDNLYGFIATVTRNLARNRSESERALKRGGGETMLVLDELRDCTGPDTVEQQIDRNELAEALNGFLGTLKPDHRKIFLQRYWYYCSVDEIAENHGLTRSKVTVTLMRTRKKLRNYLEEEGFL